MQCNHLIVGGITFVVSSLRRLEGHHLLLSCLVLLIIGITLFLTGLHPVLHQEIKRVHPGNSGHSKILACTQVSLSQCQLQIPSVAQSPMGAFAFRMGQATEYMNKVLGARL